MTREEVKMIAARALQTDSRLDLLDALRLVLDRLDTYIEEEAS